jgi:hypothetical protein
LTDEALEHVKLYNFKGNKFKREPGGLLNRRMTSVHYQACTQANFITLKKLASGETVGSVFKDGDKPSIDYLRAINESFRSAAAGKSITPVALFDEPSPSNFNNMAQHPLGSFTPPSNSTELQSDKDSLHQRYSTNRNFLCDGALLSRIPNLGPSTLVF